VNRPLLDEVEQETTEETEKDHSSQMQVSGKSRLVGVQDRVMREKGRREEWKWIS
jgi:hypothetical protein